MKSQWDWTEAVDYYRRRSCACPMLNRRRIGMLGFTLVIYKTLLLTGFLDKDLEPFNPTYDAGNIIDITSARGEQRHEWRKYHESYV